MKTRTNKITLSIHDALSHASRIIDDIEQAIDAECGRLEERERGYTDRYDVLSEAAEEIMHLETEELASLGEGNAAMANLSVTVPRDWERRKTTKSLSSSLVKLLGTCHKHLKLLHETGEDPDNCAHTVSTFITQLKALNLPRVQIEA